MERLIGIFREALAAIHEPRLFETERGYQGALLAELHQRLVHAGLPGDPIIEQEYQKTLPHHGITIRPDLIIHVPFERGLNRRAEGNFAAVEIKLRATQAEADEDFKSLEILHSTLAYPLTIFLNIDSSATHAHRCPKSIAGQTVCFAVRLCEQNPVVVMSRCADLGV